jgi:hypothetical protein
VNPQSKEPRPGGFLIILLLMLFVVVMYRLMGPAPANVADIPTAKPVVEEANTVNNRTAYEVARAGVNVILYKAEVGNDVIYFSNQGGVWGHSKP